jgi:two-component system, OmpR family, response regulator
LVSELALRIYLVEDNAIIRDNLAAALAELADTTLTGSAEGEKEAIAWLKAPTADWDLAIVDIFLKEGNGIGVVAAAKARRHDQKLVVLTNYASPGVRDQCLKLGADAVFDKSNDIDNLVDFCLQQSASAKALDRTT